MFSQSWFNQRTYWRKVVTLCCTLALFFGSGGQSWAQIPGILSYQGVLTNVNGVAVANGNYKIEFRLYAGGQLLWSETHDPVAVSNGIFTAQLGRTRTLAALPFDRPYELGIIVNGGAELTPRQPFAAAPYSRSSQTAVTAQTAAALAPGATHITLANDSNIVGLDQLVGFNDLRLSGDATGGTDFIILPDGQAGLRQAYIDTSFNILGQPGMRLLNVELSNGDNIFTINADGQAGLRQVYIDTSFTIQGRNPESNLFRVELSNGDSVLAVESDQDVWVDHTLRVVGNGYATGWLLASDARLKTQIATLPDALDKVLALRGVSFEWDQAAHPDRPLDPGVQIGFIAQEVLAVLPEVVEQDDDDGMYSVAYQNVVPVLVEAMKEQQSTIDQQQSEIAALKTHLAQLEQMVQQLAAQGGR